MTVETPKNQDEQKPTETDGPTPDQDSTYHTYTTHRIPWYIRVMWIVFWVGLIWYIVKWGIPSAKNYF